MTKYQKISILNKKDGNGQACGFDNKTLVGSIDILEVTLTACCNLEFSCFPFLKLEWVFCTKFLSQFKKFFSFDHF